ncbi:MAG: hypothetical protein WC299_05480 [Kiritimatiellia bacterium]
MPGNNYILFCHCAGSAAGNPAVRGAVLSGLRARGLPFVEVPDLCRLAAGKEKWLAALAALAGTFTVVACRPRAVRWMLSAYGIPAGDGRFQFLDLRAQSSADILARLPRAAAEVAPPPESADAWPPWFPVIDYSRCSSCRQCMNFCLFGTFAVSAGGKVTVVNPRACKNNCPACARICPEAAIIFPKLPDSESPLNGDQIVNGQDLKERARVNLHELLGNDIYAALARRREKARGLLLKSARERAEAERAACSAKGDAAETPSPPGPEAPTSG